jgi:hypothetical protein
LAFHAELLNHYVGVLVKFSLVLVEVKELGIQGRADPVARVHITTIHASSVLRLAAYVFRVAGLLGLFLRDAIHVSTSNTSTACEIGIIGEAKLVLSQGLSLEGIQEGLGRKNGNRKSTNSCKCE